MLDTATRRVEQANGDELNRRAENFAASMFGSKDKADAKEFNGTIEEYKENHTLEIFDPLGIRKIITDLEKEISDFDASVDAAIQVANATTTLEIAY